MRTLFIATFLLFSLSVFSQSRSIESIGITDVTIIEIANNGDVWAGSNGQGLAFYKQDSAKWIYYNHLNTPLQNDTITALSIYAFNGEQHALIGTTAGAVDFIDAVPVAITTLPESKIKGFVYRPDSLWILTANHLSFYDSTVTHKNDFNTPLAAATCTQRGLNNCRGLWAGTANGGCFQTSDGVNYTYIDTAPANQKLVDNRVNAIAVDNNCNAKFVGTKGGFSVCPSGNQCQNFTIADGLPQNDITSVAIGCGKIWLGTRDSGLVVFSPPSTFTRVNGLPDNHITSVGTRESDCTAYVASKDGSISIIDTNRTVVNILSGIEKVKGRAFGVRIYPQPSGDLLNFAFDSEISNGQLLLTDIAGRILQNVPLKNLTIVKTDISALPAGIYFYQLYDEHQLIKTGKLAVER